MDEDRIRALDKMGRAAAEETLRLLSRPGDGAVPALDEAAPLDEAFMRSLAAGEHLGPDFLRHASA